MLVTMPITRLAAIIVSGSVETYLATVYVRSCLTIRKQRKEAAKSRVEVGNEIARIKTEDKKKTISNDHAVHDTATPENFSGKKVPSRHAMLLGYDKDHKSVWGEAVNYIVAGTTGNGKSRRLFALLLNWLANKQGKVYIVDLKMTDYKHFIGCRGVELYVDDLEHVAEAVKAFESEYNRRIELINESYTDEQGIVRQYVDIDDYNTRNPENRQDDFILLIDEYADIADVYKDRNNKPIGVYADIIRLARKCRAVGGRIILGTQRPSVDVIIGTLKNNCDIVAMGCLNEINSKIMLDVQGAEELAPRESLLYKEGKLIKCFSYGIDNDMLLDLTDKLK